VELPSVRLFVAKDGYLRDPATREYVYNRDGGICGLCGEPADPNHWDADHVVPRSQGGAPELDNFRVAHPLCNKKRGNEVQW
jgi:5-methylcytosine-specific restriction endonuclease McrA